MFIRGYQTKQNLFLENVKIVLVEDKIRSNKDWLILVCDQDPPQSVTIEKVQFLISASDEFAAGISQQGQRLIFNITQIHGTAADNKYFCFAKVSGGSEFSTLSQFYEFNMENVSITHFHANKSRN